MASSSSSSGSWSHWSSLLAPHPDPRPFARTNRVYSTASTSTSTSPSRPSPSASTSLSPSRTAPSSLSNFFTSPRPISRSASALNMPASAPVLDGPGDESWSRSPSRSRSRSRLRLLKGKSKSKPNLKGRCSPPPSLEPLSFPFEPIIDLGSLRSFSRTPSPPPPVPPLPPGIHSHGIQTRTHGHGSAQRSTPTPHRKYHSEPEPTHPDNANDRECHNELEFRFANHDGDDGRHRRRRRLAGLVQGGNCPSPSSSSAPSPYAAPCVPWSSSTSAPNAHTPTVQQPRGSTSPPPPAHPQMHIHPRPESETDAEGGRQAESSRDAPIPPPRPTRAAEIQKRTGTYSAPTLSSAPFPHPPFAAQPPASRLQRKASTLSAISLSSRSKTKRRPPLPPVPPTPTSPEHSKPYMPQITKAKQQQQQEEEGGGDPFPHAEASTSTSKRTPENENGSTTTTIAAPMLSSHSPSPLPLPLPTPPPPVSETSRGEVRSDCGHGAPAATSSLANPLVSRDKRTSLLRHFSLNARSPSPSPSHSELKLKRTGTGSRPASPPPSSWADVACPHPTSSTTNSTLTTATSASISTSAPVSRSGSVSDFSAKLRRWSIRRGSGKQGADGSGCSSRTSLEGEGGDEDEAAIQKKGAVGRASEEKAKEKGKGKERTPLIRVVSTGSMQQQRLADPDLHLLEPMHRDIASQSQSGSSTPSQVDMPSMCSSSSSRRSSKDLQQQQQQQRTHKRNTSWGDAAVALLRGASFTSISGEGRRESKEKEKERPKAVEKAKDGESSYKGREIVDLGKDDGSVREPTPSPRRAKFTLGECDSDADLPSSSTSLPASTTTTTTTTTTTNMTAVPTSPRPPLVRRDALISESERKGRQRWTLAHAVADEGISEAALVRELERLREVRSWAGEGKRRRRVMGDGGNADEGEDLGEEGEEGADMWDEWEVEREVFEGVEEEEGSREHTESSESEPIVHRSPSHTWLATRRALLICRELIQTERHYLASLRALVAQDTASPPPPLMLHYAAEVLRASTGVLAGMEREPGMRGVARAFVDRAEEVDGAYVRWCGVVGGWFADGADEGEEGGNVVKRKRSRANHRTSVPGVDGEGEERERELVSAPPVSPLKRTVSTWRRSMPSIPSLGLGEAHHASEGAPPVPKSARKPTVRDLAILPTQRVMRYVLLYRDLLAHTPPTSSARPIIERAVDAACRIADKCDRAQNNAAFVAQSTSSNTNAHAHTNANAALLVTAGASPSASSSRSSSRREPPSRAESPSAQTTASSASNLTSTSNASSNSNSSSASTSSSASSAPTSITTPSSASSPIVHFPSAVEKLVKGPSAFKAGAGGMYAPVIVNDQTRTKRRMSASATMFKSLGLGKGRPESSGGLPQPPFQLRLPLRSATMAGGGGTSVPASLAG